MVIFLFGLEALFTRGSRAQFCAVCSLPQTVGCHWLSCLSKQFLLAPREIKPVYYSILSTVWALGKSYLSTCRHPYSLAQSSYIHNALGVSYCTYILYYVERVWNKNCVPGEQYRVGKVVLNRCTQHGTAIWKSFGDLPMYPYKYFHGEVILHLRN